MKKIVYIAWMGLLVGCGGDCAETVAENQALKQRIQNDSLFLADMDKQMQEVGDVLDSVETLTSGGKPRARDFKQQAENALVALEESFAKIAKLEEQIKNSNSSLKDNAALLRSLADKKKIIEQQRQEIEQLKGQVATLTVENQNLTTTIADRDRTIAEVNAKIGQAEQRLAELNEQIARAESQRRNLETRVQSNEQALTDNSLRDGINLMNAARTMKDGVFAGKDKKDQKAQTVREAYRLICQAHKRGNYQALTYLNQLESDAKLNKYLSGMSCN